MTAQGRNGGILGGLLSFFGAAKEDKRDASPTEQHMMTAVDIARTASLERKARRWGVSEGEELPSSNHSVGDAYVQGGLAGEEVIQWQPASGVIAHQVCERVHVGGRCRNRRSQMHA